MPTDTDNSPPSNHFVTTLSALRKGRALAEASDELTHCVQQVKLLGRKGTVTLTLTIEPDSSTDDCRVKVTDVLNVKMPQPDRKATILFADELGLLTRNHPKQEELGPVVVAAERNDEQEKKAVNQ